MPQSTHHNEQPWPSSLAAIQSILVRRLSHNHDVQTLLFCKPVQLKQLPVLK